MGHLIDAALLPPDGLEFRSTGYTRSRVDHLARVGTSTASCGARVLFSPNASATDSYRDFCPLCRSRQLWPDVEIRVPRGVWTSAPASYA